MSDVQPTPVLSFADSIMGLPINEKHQIEIAIFSRASVACRLRISGYTKNGIFDFVHTPNIDRSLASRRINIPDVPIAMHCHVESGTPRVGQCYVHLEVEVGRAAIMALSSGYVTAERPLFYPGGPHASSIDGPGVIRSITGTDPAAGAEISETVPTNARWKLIALTATCVADANAATRLPSVVTDDGTTVHSRDPPASGFTANQTKINSWGDRGAGTNQSGVLESSLLTAGLVLSQGMRIRTLTQNLQAGDDWGAPQMLVEEWIEE